MKIAKEKFASLKTRLSSALKRAREGVDLSIGETFMAFGEAAGAGIVSSYAFGAIPVPPKLPMPGAIKAGAQTATGIGMMLVPNKHVKYAGFGVGIMGTIGLVKELSRQRIPALAGEVDELMYGDSFDLRGENGNGLGDSFDLRGGQPGEPAAPVADPGAHQSGYGQA